MEKPTIKFDIPDGWFLYHADYDARPPYLSFSHRDRCDECVIEVPEEIAHYFATHHCGSNKTRQTLLNMGKEAIRHDLRNLLGIEHD